MLFVLFFSGYDSVFISYEKTIRVLQKSKNVLSLALVNIFITDLDESTCFVYLWKQDRRYCKNFGG